LLFVDFMISKEGQEVFQRVGYLPASQSVPAQTPELKPEGGKFKATVLRPEIIDAGIDRWTAVFSQLFR
jgi:ABC-type Fe3+ transport system substrate-binding protein